MSTYSSVTRHPQTGKYEVAEWRYNYFGHHIYGVYFKSDKKTYPTQLISDKQIKNFWYQDVISAFKNMHPDSEPDVVAVFLNEIDKEYKARWKRDPVKGEGAEMLK